MTGNDSVAESEYCPCCGEYIGDLETGHMICSCDTGSCPNCGGKNGIGRFV